MSGTSKVNRSKSLGQFSQIVWFMISILWGGFGAAFVFNRAEALVRANLGLSWWLALG